MVRFGQTKMDKSWIDGDGSVLDRQRLVRPRQLEIGQTLKVKDGSDFFRQRFVRLGQTAIGENFNRQEIGQIWTDRDKSDF